jgi:hypothetical protein
MFVQIYFTPTHWYAVTGLADIDCAASEILIGCKMAFFAWRIRFSR